MVDTLSVSLVSHLITDLFSIKFMDIGNKGFSYKYTKKYLPCIYDGIFSVGDLLSGVDKLVVSVVQQIIVGLFSQENTLVGYTLTETGKPIVNARNSTKVY